MCVSLTERADQRVQTPRVGPDSTEQVLVGGEPAIYVRGAWTSYGREGEPFWDPGAGPFLFMERGSVMIMLSGAPSLTKEELIRVAESLR